MAFYNGEVRANRAIIPVGVFTDTPTTASAVFPAGENSYRALIDTGATRTSVSQKVVETLSPEYAGEALMWTPTGSRAVSRYRLFVTIPIHKTQKGKSTARVSRDKLLVTAFPSRGREHLYDVVLGMDILADCALLIQFGEFVLGYPAK